MAKKSWTWQNRSVTFRRWFIRLSLKNKFHIFWLKYSVISIVLRAVYRNVLSLCLVPTIFISKGVKAVNRGTLKFPKTVSCNRKTCIVGEKSTSQKILFTRDCFSEGHPDKYADQISDAIYDTILFQAPTTNVTAKTVSITVSVHVL